MVYHATNEEKKIVDLTSSVTHLEVCVLMNRESFSWNALTANPGSAKPTRPHSLAPFSLPNPRVSETPLEPPFVIAD